MFSFTKLESKSWSKFLKVPFIMVNKFNLIIQVQILLCGELHS